MKNIKKVSETAKKSVVAKKIDAAFKKAALAKRVGTVSAKGVSAKTKTTKENTMATKKPTPKKTTTTDPEATTIDREQLLALGAELNTLLFEGSEVEYEEMEDEALEAQVRQDCTEIDPADKFSDEAKAVIAELDIDIAWAAAPKKAAAKAAPAKAEKAEKPAKEKKPAGEKRQAPVKEKGDLAIFLEAEFAKKGIEKKTEDDIVTAAKESCPDKPYRVIGNAVYAMARKAGVTLSK